ncbi:MAG TPA: hypothetical protein DEO84_01020, partial [candidate division Zixibacteria bacterium]|nr:hypothetical protein [candidate division Zixibacteria bacterium]
MKKVYGILIAMAIPAILFAQQAKYVPEKRTGIIEELIRNADSAQAVEDSITSAIRAQNPEDSEYKVIRFDIGKLKRPTSLDDFKTQFHFPPLGQYRTGTCWCFSATSFLETEAARQSGCKVKLSEMYTVYHEYLEKARHFVRSRGNYWNG